MRIRLKGINPSRKRLADGTWKTYYYAWKGGPALRGEPGTPEFVASYNAAAARKVVPPRGTLLSVMQSYQLSGEFLGLADVTRKGYIWHIKRIEEEFGDCPLAALTDRRTRGIFLAWRDRVAGSSGRRVADYCWAVLARVLSWALDRGLVLVNPCTRAGRLHRGTRRDKIWSADDEAAFLRQAAPHLHLPLLLALWTGQRQGDLLRLSWSAYDGTHIRLRQHKTGAPVVIPVGVPLKSMLDATPKCSTMILTNPNQAGRPWTSEAFASAWTRACKRAGISGLTFNDLRGTAVTRLALAGCTEAEIASITGHSLRDVRSILDLHYLHRDPGLAENAIAKLERRTKPSQPPSQLAEVVATKTEKSRGG
jgi:integrase